MSDFQRQGLIAYLSSCPPESVDRRCFEWPYYREPYGWILNPAQPPSDYTRPLWSDFVPPDINAYMALLEEIENRMSEMAAEEEDEEDVPCLYPDWEVKDTLAAARMFAPVPNTPEGRRDPAWIVYRMAQRQTEVDMTRPILHPALQFHAGAQPHEVLHWDLTQPWSFKNFATMAWMHTLFPEEELTPVSHPPLPYMYMAFDVLPGLSITITASTRGGLMLGDTMQQIHTAMEQRLMVKEWNAMREAERSQVIHGYRLRTGRVPSLSTLQSLGGKDRDPAERFLLRDALGDKVMFLGIRQYYTPGEENLWWLYTDTKVEP